MYQSFAYICLKSLWKDAQESGTMDLAPGKETGWQVQGIGRHCLNHTPSLSYLLISESGECTT